MSKTSNHIHRIEKTGDKSIKIISPVGTVTECKIKDFKPNTVLAALNEHAVDVTSRSELVIAMGGEAITIAMVVDGEIVPKTIRSSGDVERIALPPIPPEELVKQAQVAIAKKEANKTNNKGNPTTPEFKSFLARIKYMIYMDDPRGSAPSINRKQIRWELRFWLTDTSWYQVHRDDFLIYLTYFNKGTGTPVKCTPEETMGKIKELSWKYKGE